MFSIASRLKNVIYNDLLSTYIQISIGIDDCLTVICQECLDYVLNIQKFALRCAQVNKMFMKLLSGQCDDNVDLKQQNGLPENNVNSPLLSYVNFLKIEPVEDYSVSENESLDLINVKNDSISMNDTVYEFKENIVDANDRLHDDYGHNNSNDSVSRYPELQSNVERESNQSSPTTRSAQDSEPAKLNTTCTICCKTLRTHITYERHMRTKHAPSVENFVCKKCPKRFGAKKNLIEHESVHLPAHLKKTIPCPYCKKLFRTTRMVSVHIAFVHTSQRPFVCEECGKLFATSSCLNQHHITHIKERSYQCDQCDKKFKSLAHLKKHIDIHNEDSHVCPDCGKKLNTKRNLRAHMVVHSDQKKYMCQFCDFKFKRAYTLKVSRN